METAQTADYALQVLDILARDDGLSVTELATRLGLSRSVAQRVVVTMHQHAFLLRSEDGRCWLGPMLIRLGANLPHPLAAIARSAMDDLGERTGETIVLTVADGDEALVVAARAGRAGQLRVEYEVGYRHMIDRGASGLAILAFLNEADRAGRGDEGRRRILADIREAGFARTSGEIRQHMEGVAVPIRFDGFVLGSLAIVVPSTRAAILSASLSDLRHAAASIEAECRENPGAIAALLPHEESAR